MSDTGTTSGTSLTTFDGDTINKAASSLYDYAARDNWHRYLYVRDRGHLAYMEQAKKCEGMYLGGGEQWSDADKAVLDAEGRPYYEFNEIMPSINTAIGHQIQNRMDISFKPRGGSGDLLKATALSKVVMQIADECRLHWIETQVYGDGLIEQRGYYDVRMDYTKNIKGTVKVAQLDPRDVMPDPDAKSYDPDSWADVTTTRWLTLDEIESNYGQKARDAAESSNDDGPDWGTHDSEVERSKFGTTFQVGIQDAYMGDTGLKRYRIVDRQKWVTKPTKCLVFPDSGDIVILDTLTKDQAAQAIAAGARMVNMPQRRIEWVVSTFCNTLFACISPYEHFTIVPYFAYFRRGKTRGMVDNGIGPQEALNKGVSQFVHIINSVANSGWVVEQNSLTNMDTEELESIGAMTGLVVEYKAGSKAPAKIVANSVPTGIDRLIDRATQALKDVTVPDAMRGMGNENASGKAKQSDQFASQQQLAVPLDNLTYTRHMLGGRIAKLVQKNYDSYRVFRITETDAMSGKQVEKTLEINKPMPDGSYFNDITMGTYDTVIAEVPIAVTFDNSQFQQAMDMRKDGVRIPDATVIRYSSLVDKAEILENMKPDPNDEATADLTRAKAAQVRAQTTSVDIDSIYSAIQAAGAITMNPAVSPLSDALLGSAGYIDKDAAPIAPVLPPGTPPVAAPGAMPGMPQANTSPLLPAPTQGADVGMHQGIETPAADTAPPSILPS